ncbi:DUF1257 domain-containing protein [Spirulina subsalsa FACHB-351]|uniref:DUF1257 domain-containing protein n=1 Tax=Spirulina subsalsa FACHB-351 TaxID=234711 RepID=A0ABT3L1W3_9CYAN|nr:DUF1257 domain-containing protein [Spirulina subsalsa]MCW6035495.1 DUF1257 domain-containing protein [Spirulina subsalsa FACHB-351]
MSHFTTIKVQIKNGEVLQEVLQELGYQVEQNAEVRGYKGMTTQADYVIRQSNRYDLGFRRNGENYELIADFWGSQVNQQEFLNQVNQKYAHKTLLATVQEQGFQVEEQETLEDGTVRVLVGRWV